MMLAFDGLRRRFGGHDVLKGIDLSVPEGQTLVIIGRSGCGKSVLLKHAIGLLRPDAGHVIVGGDDITQLTRRELFHVRRRVGFVFQGAALFDSMTIGENVGLGLLHHSSLGEDEIAEVVREKLALVGLRGIEEKYPAELSGGMRKRVGVARAIALGPAVVLYDEPTTGLDPIMSDVVSQLIRRLQSTLGITSIVVTHDMASAFTVGDRIAMLYDGRIIFDGTPSELTATENPVVRQFIEGRATGPIPV